MAVRGDCDPLVARAGARSARFPVEHPLGNRAERAVAVGIHGGSEKTLVLGVAVPPLPDGGGAVFHLVSPRGKLAALEQPDGQIVMAHRWRARSSGDEATRTR